MARRRTLEISDAEEAEIQAQIAADPDAPELTDEELARMRPAHEILPAELYDTLTRGRGRPKSQDAKVAVKLRIDPDVLAAYRASGPGWQTRMNEALRKSMPRRPS
jgi:uncharacterized protein (DUF4415 family)